LARAPRLDRKGDDDEVDDDEVDVEDEEEEEVEEEVRDSSDALADNKSWELLAMRSMLCAG
jgi:hypothetical protein